MKHSVWAGPWDVDERSADEALACGLTACRMAHACHRRRRFSGSGSLEKTAIHQASFTREHAAIRVLVSEHLPNTFAECKSQIYVRTNRPGRIDNPIMLDLRDGAITPFLNTDLQLVS